MNLNIHRFWPSSFVEPVHQSRKLELQTADNDRSKFCPIYANANQHFIYLVLTGDVSFTWHGGTSLTVSQPDWWLETWQTERREWMLRSKGWETEGKPTMQSRFNFDKPFAGEGGGYGPFAGGMLINFFTGLSLETQPGFKTMVLPPINQTYHGWTVQGGLYDSDTWGGDFSLNLLVHQQIPIILPKGTPIATLVVLPEKPALHNFGEATQEYQEAADHFYRVKSTGVRYATQQACPHNPHGRKE